MMLECMHCASLSNGLVAKSLDYGIQRKGQLYKKIDGPSTAGVDPSRSSRQKIYVLWMSE